MKLETILNKYNNLFNCDLYLYFSREEYENRYDIDSILNEKGSMPCGCNCFHFFRNDGSDDFDEAGNGGLWEEFPDPEEYSEREVLEYVEFEKYFKNYRGEPDHSHTYHVWIKGDKIW